MPFNKVVGNGDDLIIGKSKYSGNSGYNFFDGYLAEVNYVDNVQLTPSSFGRTNATGQWVAKNFAGPWGICGFKLEFQNAGNTGQETSGTANHMNQANLNGSQDIMHDTPTNNFATWNELYADKQQGGAMAFREGGMGLISTHVDSTFTRYPMAFSTHAQISGKWYAEFLCLT